MRRRTTLSLLIASSLFMAGCQPSQEGTEQGGGAATATEVNVLTVEPVRQALTVELPGRSRAFKEAEVRPQVTGIISERNFVEGGVVEKGQSLYQIDDSSFQADLLSAEAELIRAQASEESTSATVKRYRALITKKSISQQDLDEAEAAYKEAKAQVLVAKAKINTAKINLTYTRVKAPISGVISKSNVTAGALVTANQADKLTTIQQLDPINVDIVQSSAQLLRLKAALSQGHMQEDQSAQVALTLEDGSTYEHKGTMKFTEVNVDESTGSVTLRAEFPNPDGLLLPGMFVRATVITGVDPSAILIPQNTVTRDATGKASVMTVSADNTVAITPVITAEVIDNQWRIIDGLKAGDQVITAGLQKVRPGSPVTIQTGEQG
ncbi:TPA: multidrug efflux RND transporter periplasmic adaptor subunit VmeA [Vibrio parahaemolyticus]|uniref:multidrug efflux RND transporter periplasmic adaptor subunit VmeA n=1 Tax=Vibrio parahaemolyticus TaxID=670 RepID=UPI00193E3267|nr:multidrug efflux RND transporter periplasmic adaptor subunit VmeA [Vibrio parahaemolyticus]MBM5166659.1 multidrug efflux RND transporter periplasmic adaptor subunit VmeA [Vibrio parahaemolyticus]MCR9973071.1 multidrug efflux RND transporter periplasmic adaptor subunit VmeA [Vibrio parahaemolyticus]MCS0020164.1 multidrug efflux RND transporter periplasmic adaptor subunit VmeA [Vibrio parahaemolyticus]MCS0056460.1 multidrug efflux RND transporter periplasmic adaptor subunit VmeA [Vibrio paraha